MKLATYTYAPLPPAAQGTCPGCLRKLATKSSCLARHGWQEAGRKRQVGVYAGGTFHTGPCLGAGMRALEYTDADAWPIIAALREGAARQQATAQGWMRHEPAVAHYVTTNSRRNAAVKQGLEVIDLGTNVRIVVPRGFPGVLVVPSYAALAQQAAQQATGHATALLDNASAIEAAVQHFAAAGQGKIASTKKVPVVHFAALWKGTKRLTARCQVHAFSAPMYAASSLTDDPARVTCARCLAQQAKRVVEATAKGNVADDARAVIVLLVKAGLGRSLLAGEQHAPTFGLLQKEVLAKLGWVRADGKPDVARLNKADEEAGRRNVVLGDMRWHIARNYNATPGRLFAAFRD